MSYCPLFKIRFPDFSCLCFHISEWKLVASFHMRSYRSSSTFVIFDIHVDELLDFLRFASHTDLRGWLCIVSKSPYVRNPGSVGKRKLCSEHYTVFDFKRVLVIRLRNENSGVFSSVFFSRFEKSQEERRAQKKSLSIVADYGLFCWLFAYAKHTYFRLLVTSCLFLLKLKTQFISNYCMNSYLYMFTNVIII